MRLFRRIASFWQAEWRALRRIVAPFTPYDLILIIGMSAAFGMFAMSIQATKPVKLHCERPVEPFGPAGIVITTPKGEVHEH